jgi:hypothetical protein
MEPLRAGKRLVGLSATARGEDSSSDLELAVIDRLRADRESASSETRVGLVSVMAVM